MLSLSWTNGKDEWNSNLGKGNKIIERGTLMQTMKMSPKFGQDDGLILDFVEEPPVVMALVKPVKNGSTNSLNSYNP